VFSKKFFFQDHQTQIKKRRARGLVGKENKFLKNK
jgi:hypothetical protein